MKNNNQVFVNLDILVSENNHISVLGCDYVDCNGNEQPIRIRKVDSIWDTFNEGRNTCIPQIPINLIFYIADKSNYIVRSFPFVVRYDIKNQIDEGEDENFYFLFDFKSSLHICYKKSKCKMVVIAIEKISIEKMFQNTESTTASSEDNHFQVIAKENIKQYIYRYVVSLKHKINAINDFNSFRDGKIEQDFEYIEEVLFDGTYNKMHDDSLMKYHKAGKPKKLVLKWHIKKSEYYAFFWFEDEEICAFFNKFYGQHLDTKTDLIILIDPIMKKYELSLYRYGLKLPAIIPDSAYQLIVFKSGFEYYRSDNYNKPTGAWIW